MREGDGRLRVIEDDQGVIKGVVDGTSCSLRPASTPGSVL